MPRHNRLLLSAGLIPLPWFLAWSLAAAALATGYSSVSQHASELLQFEGLPSTFLRIAAIGSGAAFVAFAIGLWWQSGVYFAVGACGWLVFGLAMASNGIWPMGDPKHGLYAAGVINLIAPAVSHLESRVLVKSGRFYALTAFVSVAGVIYLWLNLVGADPPAYRGLTQRVFSSICSLWPFVTALWLLRSDSLPAEVDREK
ncbi:MAG: DUF998 domain-containing protein [Planctomycetia bacterium]|nr:DUF998 domain-containing protein [Planctomycetia bacterium]